ncbi:MAG: peptide-methionine (S)-S-oxide reductase MsrA [Actinobacteria bacterium]|nr:peptide-methionine (S)-S-oxide reductase MsrA [Actinomycetota bacterium]
MHAYFATGCFWGAQRRFWNTPGVTHTSVGYMGGMTNNPTYDQVCTGATGHAEVVLVEFNPEEISFEELLKEFWTMHDPTTVDRQGNDIGSQYRSAIFVTSPEQFEIAIQSRDQYQSALTSAGIGLIVTEINAADSHTYYLAEEYHQRYLEKNPNGYDCHSTTGIPYPAKAISK